MANKEKLRSLINSNEAGRDLVGLEIGPSFDPIVAKRDGHNVEILDHMSAADLRLKYQNAPHVDLSAIEEVDYISDGGSIFELVGKPAHYDYIVASHVIEHTVDLLRFLEDCQGLLKPDGRLILAVPDMRFSFDCLRPVSTTGQVVEAYFEKAKRHSLAKLFDEMAYNCRREGEIGWPRGTVGKLAFFRPVADAKWILEEYRKDEAFVDIHAWQFSPSSFRLIVSDLYKLGLIELREQSFDASQDNEFFVVLSKKAGDCPLTRMALAECILVEQTAIFARIPFDPRKFLRNLRNRAALGPRIRALWSRVN